MDRLQQQDEARKARMSVNKDEQEVNDYRRDINAAHQQAQKERNNRRNTRETQERDMAEKNAKENKKRQRAQNFVMAQQNSYMEKVENNIEKQYMDQVRNAKIADKNVQFMERTTKMFNDRKAAEAEEKEEEERLLHEAREAHLQRLREGASERAAAKQDNLRLEEKRERNNEKAAYERHRRELARAQKIQQDQKDENMQTGTVPMRIVLAKNQFINIPLQEVLQHVVHEQKELDILKKIDFELLKGSDGQLEDEQIFRTCTRLLAEAQEHKLSIPDCSLAAFQSF